MLTVSFMHKLRMETRVPITVDTLGEIKEIKLQSLAYLFVYANTIILFNLGE